MPSIEAPESTQAFTANGDGTGYVTMTTNAGFYVGAIAYLYRTTKQERVIITELVGTTQVGVRIIAPDNEQQGSLQVYGGRSDLTGYTTVLGSKLSMPSQLVRVEPAWQRALGLNV